MIDAIFNVPEKLVEIDKNKIYTNGKAKIIIVFLDNDFNIADIDKKTYDEWLHDERITEEGAKLLDCQKFIGTNDIKPSRKGFGAQYGMSTCSPIHFKLTNTYEEAIINYSLKRNNNLEGKFIDEKLKAFIEGHNGLRNKNYFKDIREKIIPIIKKVFLEIIIYNNKDILLKNNLKEIIIDNNDYLLIKIKDELVEYFISEHNLFLKSIESSYFNKNKTESCCFVCGKKISEGINILIGNFEGEQRKHNQLFHKFYHKVNYKSNVFICDNCNKKLFYFFKKVNDSKKRYIPIPLNLRIDYEDYNYIIFGKESFLEKLKKIYEINNDNPFDYVFLTINSENDFVFDYIPGFNYYLKTNNEVLNLSFNKKSNGDYLIVKKESFSKGDFINHLDNVYLKRRIIINKLYSDIKNLKIDSFIKLIFLEYKEHIINILFKEQYWFQKEGIRRLIIKILGRIQRVKILKDYYLSGYNHNGRIMLLFYYLYYQSEDVKMEIKSLKEIEEDLNNWKSLTLDNDFKAAYLAGQMVYYLLSMSESSKNKLDLLGTYLISVKNIDQLKKKIIDLTLRYKHKIISTAKWNKLNKLLLSYDFNNKQFEELLIPFFTGFYADNVFYQKNKEGDNNE